MRRRRKKEVLFFRLKRKDIPSQQKRNDRGLIDVRGTLFEAGNDYPKGEEEKPCQDYDYES